MDYSPSKNDARCVSFPMGRANGPEVQHGVQSAARIAPENPDGAHHASRSVQKFYSPEISAICQAGFVSVTRHYRNAINVSVAIAGCAEQKVSGIRMLVAIQPVFDHCGLWTHGIYASNAILLHHTPP
ncbi:hypothetical protein M2352_001465 [Azospirillum fermentarium]|uniref:hypothetical protein n=1 Tax=Azospirillum fermentarium TaxID=1233114 RepID=UPI0022279360|nr:hypothetical protein [Azospirillum fermentarium]MCW2245874.1 hypothetical protein [Azospirillum fermentarium]